jgi:uncharacterized membrane protein YraQ (UPF0718 family)
MKTSELSIGRTVPKRQILLIVALLALGFMLRDQLFAAIVFAVSSLWQITPIVLAGLLITGVLTATGSIGLLVVTFDAREFSAIVLVSLVGAVLPVCGITLLPVVAGLLSAGMALAPVMAFLLSSAVTDPSMFAVTSATLGLPFAVGKTAAAFGIGVLGGATTWGLVRFGWFERPVRQSSMFQSLVPESACYGPIEADVHWRFWDDPERLTLFAETCWRMAKLVVLFLSVAFVAEYFLKLYLPEDALAGIVGQDNPLAIPIAAIVAAPLYLDGYAALPLVRGLIDLGMAEGAAMAFLIAGGIISAWTAIPVFALVRLPVFLAYIVMAVVGSVLAGWVYAVAVV